MVAARPGRCAVFIAILALAGCSEPDAIRVHEEPPPPARTAPSIPADQKKFRTFAAMVPADMGASDDRRDGGERWWFFKLSGPYDLVSKYEADFNRLIDSVKSDADGDSPVFWTLPPGWTREPGGSAMRYATLKSPGGDTEIAVTRFNGMVVQNVQRWWVQLWGKDHSDDVNQATVGAYSHQRLVNGRIIITVDLAGPKDPNFKDPNGMGPMMGHPPIKGK